MEFVTALRTSSFDEAKPSLFELLSEAQLAGLLPPTLRYLLAVATQRYPRYLLRALNSFDEVYALAALIVERHYLRTRGGSFTEHFYGLKRELVPAAGDLPRAASAARDVLRLRDSDVWANLAVIVLVPYLRRKLDEAYEVDAPRRLLGAAYNRPPGPDATRKERAAWVARWLLRNVYPSVNAGYGFAVLAFNLAYLFDRSRYHHPLMWLIGSRVRRMGAQDHMALEMMTKKTGAPPGSMFAPRNVAARVLGGLSLVLPMSIFALKFLEWWHASDFARQLSRRAAETLELPPPVVTGLKEAEQAKADKQEEEKLAQEAISEGEKMLRSETIAREEAENAPIATPSLLPIYTVAPPLDSAMCPICETEITTATACQTGFVYCYSCIHKWLTGQHPKQEKFMDGRAGKWESGLGRCAVTGRRVLGGTEGLRRVIV
jgi:peroxin-12